MVRFIALLLITLGCAQKSKSLEEPIIISAEWQNWHGGISTSAGTKYHFQFIYSNTQAITFDSVRIDDVGLHFSKLFIQDSIISITANDDYSVSKDPTKALGDSRKNLRNTNPQRAVIYFRINDQKNEMIIEEFKRKKNAYYQ
ncbi:MAG: hypothetical protein JXQ90_15145 [Cyclobacteriaceae bacterium]